MGMLEVRGLARIRSQTSGPLGYGMISTTIGDWIVQRQHLVYTGCGENRDTQMGAGLHDHRTTLPRWFEVEEGRVVPSK